MWHGSSRSNRREGSSYRTGGARIARADGARLDPITWLALAARKTANFALAIYAAVARTVQAVRIRPHVIHMNNHVRPGFEWVVAGWICRAKLRSMKSSVLAW